MQMKLDYLYVCAALSYYTPLSKILEKPINNDIAIITFSPVLYIGLSEANFILSGYIPCSRDALNM
jgi:hypothetical protein